MDFPRSRYLKHRGIILWLEGTLQSRRRIGQRGEPAELQHQTENFKMRHSGPECKIIDFPHRLHSHFSLSKDLQVYVVSFSAATPRLISCGVRHPLTSIILPGEICSVDFTLNPLNHLSVQRTGGPQGRCG